MTCSRCLGSHSSRECGYTTAEARVAFEARALAGRGVHTGVPRLLHKSTGLTRADRQVDITSHHGGRPRKHRDRRAAVREAVRAYRKRKRDKTR
jgi:hypothetical protein